MSIYSLLNKSYKTFILSVSLVIPSHNGLPQSRTDRLDIPDSLIMEAYERAATQNVLESVKSDVFFGYFSVCADGIDFGYGNSYPSLDGHQLTDALLWLGQADVVKANWNYVKSFQKPDGQLPLAILPGLAGQMIGPMGFQSQVDPNGGLYRHWVPGDPLRALAGPTYIQNADVIFRHTQDVEWLLNELPSINLAGSHLATLVTAHGAVKGAGYYIERPTRVEYDGVAQCHATDAFRRIAALNERAGNRVAAWKFRELANKIERHFKTRFWMNDRFAEYIHPVRGPVTTHGLTDTDWSSIALGLATGEQTAVLWPKLKEEDRFYYGGMPAGIATLPLTYEKWESTYDDVNDLASMGRVWYVEAAARARMGDAAGLTESIRRVCRQGRKEGYYWRERYNDKGGYGAHKYCEYPANLIRIVQRYLLGVEHELDGTLSIRPTVPYEFWEAGFGQTLSWQDRKISYKMNAGSIKGDYYGSGPQTICVRLARKPERKNILAVINGKHAKYQVKGDLVSLTLPAASVEEQCRFEIILSAQAPRCRN